MTLLKTAGFESSNDESGAEQLHMATVDDDRHVSRHMSIDMSINMFIHMYTHMYIHIYI